ncbi:3-oxoacyl-[acyl-carrier-protein] synthase 2 [Corynebacterium faecale]|uniref:type I polyketide synthase n=1 Tax=Corynebacterium faecale TaxID=1758466 RepID=UPI0025B61BD5|nr:type I polyketide synthase [Corynebacterium faecale]WJY91589.1 3-oxoacyl-[acyl-carrier-protein] synthase 2 [Corynebacterium faecale]
MSISSLTPLHSFKEPAILYAGQASAWQQVIADASVDHIAASHLRELLSRARAKTAPFARQVTSIVPGSLARLDELTREDADHASDIDPQPAVSIPGIVLGQVAASRQLRDLGLDVDNATRLGHSQGILGVEAAVNEEDVLAFAILLGAAASQFAGKGDHMLSVRGLDRDTVEAAIAEVDGAEVALRNARTHFVISAQPAQLKKAAAALQRAADSFNEDITDKRKGGSLLEPKFDYLPVAIPFHHSSMQEAADLAVEWSTTCGLDVDAKKLAYAILVESSDWVAQIADLKADYVLTLDSGLARFTAPLLDGTGITQLPAYTAAERDNLARPGFQIPTSADWSEFAPKLVKLPTGETKVQTRFSSLTGYSPILLGGMTPTTVDPTIVAAAANAGYWAEMAGGGQYSEEVFTRNKEGLVKQLNVGRAAQFNSMFFDRYIWNLQFGAQRIVSRARAAGTAIDGVVVSAGIPEAEEATELINGLNEDGFPYIAFKPGTVDQIRATLAIADGNPDSDIIIQVEDGHAGGHHSWVNLDDLLLTTYAEIRARKNVVLAIGGGIGTPAKAAYYLTGQWSEDLGYPKMPVDGIIVGTAAMATKEATTSPQVKQALVDTPGVDPQDAGGWVGRGDSRGGVTSGLSHLHADMYELDNDSAAASRLISSIDSDDVDEHREELIAALNKTAKPFFGDLEEMTYAEWIERWVDLAHPSQDPTWDDRLFDLVHRLEARLNDADHGEIETLFPDLASIEDAPAAVDKLLATYPNARELKVSARDAAWFIGLCRKHHKPMPWVPAIDADLARWWGLDTLWQAHNERYDANAVRVIPGPVSVAGIDRVDEPVADLLGRFEEACVEALDGEPEEIYARLNDAKNERELLLSAPHIVWHGNLIDNPANVLKDGAFELIEEDGYWIIRILADSVFDDIPVEQRPYLVKHVDIPVELSDAVATGASPVVSREKLPESVYALLAGVAGVGSVSAAGDKIEALPTKIDDGTEFGYVRDSFTLPRELLVAHTAVTGAALEEHNVGTGDVLVGVCWPALYASLGTGKLADGYPVIEGLLNAVHLDHLLDLRVPLEELADGRTIDVESRCASIEESSSGRIVTVRLTLSSEGEVVAKLVTRFAIRGRITTTDMAQPAESYGGRDEVIEDTPRSFVRSATVTAPADMTPFAMVSGDYNPIHTSANAAKLVGLDAPLVHGMWLSATAQHLAGLGSEVVGWTYSMYGMVQLNDVVDITVERVGRSGLKPAYEVTCRIDGNVVSRGQALLKAPTTAYVYPGQGIQAQGMGQGDRNASPEARAVWERADAHTRANLGFSIQQVIDENPIELKVGDTTFVHPKGVLNLTQFTQVALAVVAYAQTARLQAAGAIVDNSLYAGHSLGEYTALASLGNIFELEGVIDVVYSRGSAMHSLVPRDAQGRSDYALAAFRPNMIGLSGTEVENWIDRVAEESGEFLQIVNYNVDGQQYAVAGTLKGLKALKASATANPRAYVDIPGIDVPFHSSVLRPGVPAFAQKLDELLPETIDIDALRGRYIPNLVARPFELTQDFVDTILAVVPSERLKGLKVEDMEENALARLLLIELLSWQFASPVRWIETQALIIDSVDQIIEVGLAASPTLTNLALRTMDVIGEHRPVFNVERDQDQVMLNDVRQAPVVEIEEDDAPAESASAAAATQAPVTESVPAPAAPAAAPVAVADAPELKYNASNAIMTLFALQNKIKIDQITAADTSETLTNGVSSRRNQMLMDMSTELSVPTIDGAADADVATLQGRVVTAAPGYKPFGPVLGEAIRARLRALLGAAGLKASYVGDRVTGTWGLPESWVAHVEVELLLGTREGESVRGGNLGTLPESAANKGEVDSLIDAAVNNVAAANGTSVSMSAGGSAAGGGVVDSAALDAYASTVTGEEGVLANIARGILGQLGLDAKNEVEAAEADTELYEAVEAELGAGWQKMVTPVFSAERAILFDDRWASAREDLARLANGADIATDRFTGTGETVAKQAAWWADHVEDATLATTLSEVAKVALETADEPHAEDVALVTGAAPESIAGAVAGRLLAQGATVIMTASNVSQARKEYARKLYAQHASPSAKLWIVPANMSSYRDVDAVIDWIGNEQRVTVGSTVTVTKPALTPTLAYPFAAPSVSGNLSDAGPQTENQARLLLWSVERTIAGLADLASRGAGERVHIVLPGSPNRGMFGGDGAYGEVKAAFDAILAKWGSETGWPNHVTLAQARIGWVAGTGLMGRNDVLIPAAEKLGIHVYTPEEISSELLGLGSAESRKKALEAPIDYDLTGGLGGGISIAELAASLEQDEVAADNSGTAIIKALPSPKSPVQVPGAEVGEVTTDLDDMIVMVGVGEISSWGSGRTRFEAEYGIQRDGSVELTAAGVVELAWMMGLITWSEDPRPGWYDVDGTEVPEEDIFDRYRDEVVARCGIRELVNDAFLVEGGSMDAAEIFLDRDITFSVTSEDEALAYQDADATAEISQVDGEWTVTKKKGSTSFVPRKATLTRSVAGQLPTDFDPAKWGIPASMIDALDNIAAWNLVTAVDAFLSSGFSPAELLQSVHPADVSSTQGTGIGGMQSLRKLFVNRFLGQDRPSDILQETLPNVVAAHTMQSYVGGYGQMIHPVAACATAAVSVEEGVDKIRLGKADFVVAGGIDDIQVESLTGFGDMNATADTQAMLDKGIDPRFISRANDRRRAGFLEAAGGGTVLLARASLAAELGLPVLAVVAHAQSYADGAHTSIPAPGLGALGAARGGTNSRLAKELKGLGLTPDDVRVVSKHDTSTNANDPNESELHNILWKTIGREADNPMFIISQKSLTGHSKGGAALFQIGGLVSVLESGKLPQNASLDCVDPEMAAKGENFVWLREPLDLGAGAIKAGVLTSLGFGHVAAVVVMATSGVFEQAMRNAGLDVEAWRKRATERLRAGANRLEAGMVGRAPLFEQIDGRRLPERGGHQAEINLLIDAEARLGADGTYPAGK